MQSTIVIFAMMLVTFATGYLLLKKQEPVLIQYPVQPILNIPLPPTSNVSLVPSTTPPSTTPPSTTPPSTTPPSTTPPSTTPPSTTPPLNVSKEILDVFNAINAKRSLPPLQLDAVLQKMAQEFADDQANTGSRLSFTDSKGRNFNQRAKDNEYIFTKVQEMEWYFPGNADSVANGILQQLHLDSSFKRIGIGYRAALLPIWIIEITN
jgi:uncharacterized protein YkwD